MKKLILFLTLVFVSTMAMAQATSLVVDNQTPGWLSSKINYGDQQTVVNLKVTGYINQDDVTFINQLISKQKLHGRLDLEDANIIGDNYSYSFKKDSTMYGPDWENHGGFCYISGELKHFLLPKSLKAIGYACEKVIADTITLGSWTMQNIIPKEVFRQFQNKIKCLIFREGVQFVGTDGGDTFHYRVDSLREIVFPSTLKKIGIRACANLKALKKVNLPDSVSDIGNEAFWQVPAFQDTVFLPKSLEKYHVGSFANGYIYVSQFQTTGQSVETFENQHVYIPDNVSQIDFNEVNNIKSHIYFHIKNPNPPTIGGTVNNQNSRVLVYVPKSIAKKYQSDEHWSKFNIIVEPNPATAVRIASDSTRIKKNYTNTLTATITPNDADSKTVNWYSGDINIASVSAQGIVTAHNSGKTYIYVELADNPSIKDSCLVTVYQPVSGIQLNVAEKELKVGEYYDLSTTVSPSDADNKNVRWKSEDETIASVSNGRITARRGGKVKITASSAEDSTINAVCNITVVQPVEGLALSQSTYTLNGIGETVQLNATVTPEDASNKTVNWKSSDEKVCIVSNGMVVAVGYGSAVIIAITADGGFMATCTITVNNATGIQNVHKTNTSIYRVFGIDGKEKPSLQKGINIIKFEDGSTRKVVIK